jgi:Sushi repeat (SCR repeat)
MKIKRFILLGVLLSSAIAVLKADCVFPGLPKNGYGRQIINETSKDIKWDTTFEEGAVVVYGCKDGFQMKMLEDRSTTCTGEQWNRPVPKCRNDTRGLCHSITYC